MNCLDDSCVLAPPHIKKGSTTDKQLIRRICVCLTTRFNISFTRVSRYVGSLNIEQYARVRRLQGGDTMHASSLVTAGDDRREASYVRVRIILMS